MNNMKYWKILTLVTVLAAIVSCNQKKGQGVYGEKFEINNPLTVDDLLAKMEGKDVIEAQVKGVITGVCKSEGCWITFTTKDGEAFYINTKDKAFSLPPEVVGKTAIAKGSALSIEKQKQIEIEAGEDPDDLDWIDAVSFSADGIIVQ